MTVKKFTVITMAAVCMITAAIISAKYLKNEQEMNLSVSDNIEEENNEPLPYIDQETQNLMIPLRRVIEQMGGKVEWNQNFDSIVISYKNTLMEIVLDGTEGTINGNPIVFTNSWINKNNIIYVSTDFMSDYFNTEIEWDGNIVGITSKSAGVEPPIIAFNAHENRGTINSYYVNIPVITGLVDRNYEKQLNMKFNTEIIEDVSAYSENAIEQYRNNPNSPERSVDWKYISKTMFRSPEFISILSTSDETFLDSHIETSYESINIDLQGQKEVSLMDMFKNDQFLEIYKEKYENMQINLETANFYIKDGNMIIYMLDETGNLKEYVQDLNLLKKYLKNEYHVLIK